MIATRSGEMKGVADYLKWDHWGQDRKKRLFALKGSEGRQISRWGAVRLVWSDGQ